MHLTRAGSGDPQQPPDTGPDLVQQTRVVAHPGQQHSTLDLGDHRAGEGVHCAPLPDHTRSHASAMGREDRLNLWSGQAAALASGAGAGPYLAALVAEAEKALGTPL